MKSPSKATAIDGGDWSEDRLIPDTVRCWQAGETLRIRRPQAIRPWQHVLEPLAGYLTLVEALWTQPNLVGAYNFGPAPCDAATVRTVVELARNAVDNAKVNYGDSNEGPHEASWLALEIAKARRSLGYTPHWNLQESVRRTMEWYNANTLAKTPTACARATLRPMRQPWNSTIRPLREG